MHQRNKLISFVSHLRKYALERQNLLPMHHWTSRLQDIVCSTLCSNCTLLICLYTYQRILRARQQQPIMEWRELHISYGVGMCMEQRHGFALASTVIERQDCHAGAHMLPVEGHEGSRCANIVPIRLVWAHTNISNTCLWFGHDWCRIFVFGGFKTPSHLYPLYKKLISLLLLECKNVECNKIIWNNTQTGNW